MSLEEIVEPGRLLDGEPFVDVCAVAQRVAAANVPAPTCGHDAFWWVAGGARIECIVCGPGAGFLDEQHAKQP